MSAKYGSCCCCLSLTTGAIIIGTLNFVGAIISLLWNVIAIAGLALLLEFFKLSKESVKKEGVGDEAAETLDEAAKEVDNSATWFFIILGLSFVESIVQLGVSVLLIVGADQKDVRKVRIWFRVALVLLILLSAVFVIQLIQGNYAGAGYSGVIAIRNVYFLYIIRSLISELQTLAFPNTDIPPIGVRSLGP